MKTIRTGTSDLAAFPGALGRLRARWAILFLMSLVSLLCLAGLGGCLGAKEDNTRVAGGDDIPNDVEPLGKKSARARDDSADWNGFKTMPRTSPGMYDTTSVPDSIPDTSGSGQAQPRPKQGALAKGSGRAGSMGGSELPGLDGLEPLDTLITRVVDTARGAIEAVHTQVKDSIRQVDSTVFVPADPARPGTLPGLLQVTGKITYSDTSLWKAYSFRDADGDGFLAPRAGSANLADLDVSVKAADGTVARTLQRLAAGGDLDFNARGDNRILSSTVIRTLGADTVAIFRLVDADGDSMVLDFGKDTNVVDLIEEHRYGAGSPIASMTQKARLVAFSKDSTRNYAVRFERRTVLRDGAILAVSVKGAAADSSFHAGTEAAWIETRTPPAGDSLSSSTRAYAVKLAPDPGAYEGNLLMYYFAEEIYRGGVHERFAFDFRPEIPVVDGRRPALGAVTATLVARAGTAVAFRGEAVAAGMEGVVTSTSGGRWSVFFDRNGVATLRR